MAEKVELISKKRRTGAVSMKVIADRIISESEMNGRGRELTQSM